jgi:hypothetical protein
MPLQNFTTWDEEEDGNNRLSQTTVRSTFTGLLRSENARLCDDKGIDHFNADFEHDFDFRIDIGQNLSVVLLWTLSKEHGTYNNQIDSLFILHTRNTVGTDLIRIRERDNSTDYSSYDYTINSGQTYYGRIIRSGSSFMFKIFSDAERTNQLKQLSLTLHNVKAYRWIYAPLAYSGVGDYYTTGYVENLDLKEVVIPTVTTQNATDVGRD